MRTIETIEALENHIQRILLDFVDTTGHGIHHVRVDTRNFANLAVEITLKDFSDKVSLT